MDNLQSKYSKVLELFSHNYDKQELVEILDKSVSIIKKNYNNYDVQHQIAGAYVIVELYNENKSFNFDKIEETLKEFFDYFDNEYQKYVNSLVILRDRMSVDLTFYNSFITNKIIDKIK